jgi:hypothetical protein
LTTTSGGVFINGEEYPPVVPPDTLSIVLNAGNTANNSIILSNGTNTTTLNPTSITSTTFIGDLSGNATTSTTATNAVNVEITDQPSTATTYYLTFVTGTTGNLPLNVDSSVLTYNSSTNLLLVNGLQLSTVTNTVTFASNTLTINCNSASNRDFTFPITADVNTLNLTNRRTNGIYKVNITNSSGANRTINNSLGTTTSQPNRTSYNPSAVISVGDTWVMTIKVLNFAGTQYNCVSLEKFV